jgi:hypothetical protein
LILGKMTFYFTYTRAGLGVVFGEFVFDNVGVGIAVGAALGIAFSRFSRSK